MLEALESMLNTTKKKRERREWEGRGGERREGDKREGKAKGPFTSGKVKDVGMRC